MLSPRGRSDGEVPERSNGAVSKTVVLLAGDRGFESLPLRQPSKNPWPRMNLDIFGLACYESMLRKGGWEWRRKQRGSGRDRICNAEEASGGIAGTFQRM